VTAAAAVAASLFFGLSAGTAVAASGAGESSDRTRVSVDISAQRFVVEGDQVIAKGPVLARVVRPDGTTTTVEQQVELKVQATSKCRILELNLAKLYLNLLGLEVRTSAVNVEITGDPRQTLGKLFCSLSEGLKLDKSLLAKRSARSLNRELDGQPLPILSFKAPVYQQQQQSSSPRRARGEVPPPSPDSCEVLDLLLGPLHLDLLGLVVDLYGPSRAEAVRVLVSADPNGGELGRLFCEVGGEPEGQSQPEGQTQP